MVENFKPALLFLAKFLAIYFVGNILYGLYVESTNNAPDLFTRAATYQTATLLNLAEGNVAAAINPNAPTVFIQKTGYTVLNVYEGCNGINVMIVFVAFLIAFGGPPKKLAVFGIAGLFIIHLANLLRIAILYYVSLHYEHYFYFIHKYFFTAILYLIVFLLWAVWVFRFNSQTVKTNE